MGYLQDRYRYNDHLYLFEADRRERQMMEYGSRNLLKALWREHPTIMRHQFMVGRAAERP